MADIPANSSAYAWTAVGLSVPSSEDGDTAVEVGDAADLRRRVVVLRSMPAKPRSSLAAASDDSGELSDVLDASCGACASDLRDTGDAMRSATRVLSDGRDVRGSSSSSPMKGECSAESGDAGSRLTTPPLSS
jgi:hypothetical protein